MTINFKGAKILAACLIGLLISGCGEVEQVSVTIINVEKLDCGGDFMCGCIGGLDYITVIKTEDGKVDSMCAYVGEVGEVITGYWTSGHWDGSSNGFRRVN